jgi:hypothetical protein
MNTSHFFFQIGVFFLLSATVPIVAQVAASPQTPQPLSSAQQATVLSSDYLTKETALWEQREALLQGLDDLIKKGTPDELITWQQQNASQLASFAEQGKDLSSTLSLPTVAQWANPPGASTELKEYLQNQATFANSFSVFHNQSLATSPTPPITSGSSTTVPSIDDAVGQQVIQQNALLLSRKNELLAIITAQQAQNPTLLPPTLVLPLNASPQIQAYLTAKDQLTRDITQIQNQYRLSNPTVRNAALQQWQLTNAARIAQLNQLAQTLSQQTQSSGGTSE